MTVYFFGTGQLGRKQQIYIVLPLCLPQIYLIFSASAITNEHILAVLPLLPPNLGLHHIGPSKAQQQAVRHSLSPPKALLPRISQHLDRISHSPKPMSYRRTDYITLCQMKMGAQSKTYPLLPNRIFPEWQYQATERIRLAVKPRLLKNSCKCVSAMEKVCPNSPKAGHLPAPMV